MSGLLAGLVITSMSAAAFCVMMIFKYHRRIVRIWLRGRSWFYGEVAQDGAGVTTTSRDEEDGFSISSKVSAPQTVELAALTHKPLTPAYYAVMPPPFLLHTPPLPTSPLPMPMPPARAVLPPARSLPQQGGPAEVMTCPIVLRKSLPPLPKPMLPNPPPPLSPIPPHRSHLVPPPLRVGPSRLGSGTTQESALSVTVQPAASNKASEDDDNNNTQTKQQQPEKQESTSNTDPADTSSLQDNSLSPKTALRNSAASGSTGSDITDSETPCVMQARTQSVERVSKLKPGKQSPYSKTIVLLDTSLRPSRATPTAKSPQPTQPPKTGTATEEAMAAAAVKGTK